MCSIIALLLLAFAGFFGFTTFPLPEEAVLPVEPSVIVASTVEAPTLLSCAAPSATDDMANMLQLIDTTLFEPPLWSSESSLQSNRTTATWKSDTYGAVAYLEYLHYDCGYTEAQIDTYYSPENWALIFSGYDSYTKSAECRYKDTRLYQFDVHFRGSDYAVRYWVVPATDTRVFGLMLVFPVEQQATLAQYSGHLFPQFPSCADAAG